METMTILIILTHSNRNYLKKIFHKFQIEDGTVNLTMGAIIISESRFIEYSASFPSFYGSLGFAIPPGKPYSSFEKLFLPFQITIWSCICTLFVIASITITALKFAPKNNRNFLIGKSNDMPFFTMVNIFLGGAINSYRIPVRNFARTLLTIWLLSSLILRNAYQGMLFDSLRGDQRKAPLYYLDDIYKSDVDLYIYESFYQNILDMLPESEQYR